MVILEFQPAALKHAFDDHVDLHLIDPGVLVHTSFVVPVRFMIDATELLEMVNNDTQRVLIHDSQQATLLSVHQRPLPDPWWALPLLHVATVAVTMIEHLPTAKTGTYDLPGSGMKLRFTLTDQTVVVHSGINRRTATTTYNELRQVFRDVAAATAIQLRHAFPDLTHHPQWTTWFPADGRVT